jgi:TRAP-type C4-dicarboxylate transport system substrate-binding protein
VNRRVIASLAGAVAIAAATAAAAQQPIVIKLASPSPPRSFMNTEVFQPWADEVNKASEGTLKVELHTGGTLGNFGVMYDRVVDGVADLGFIIASFSAGKFRMHEVAALPFESTNSVEAATALWRMYEKGVTTAEFSEVRPIAIWTFANATIHSRERIRLAADVKGKKITVGNSATGRIVATLGGSPLVFRPDELYQVLQRGTADGSLINFSAVGTFKLAEVARYHVDLPLGGDPAMLIMNRKKYDSLPPKAKAAIDRSSYLAYSQKVAKRTDEDWEMNRNAVKDNITPLGAQELENWKKALTPVAAAWTKEVPNGAKILASFREELKAYNAKK